MAVRLLGRKPVVVFLDDDGGYLEWLANTPTVSSSTLLATREPTISSSTEPTATPSPGRRHEAAAGRRATT